MIHQRRLHLSLPDAAQRDEPRQRPDLTPEQAAILSLLDRVEALEAALAFDGGNIFAGDWP